jgi:hypothetical protein
MALALSLLALLATFYQLYLQRVHNEKSLKPLVQIDVYDRNNLIAVRIQNNGLGPFIIEGLSFVKGHDVYNSIRQCISLDPKSYHNVGITKTEKKVILPNSYLDVFSVRLEGAYTEEYVANIKQELSVLKLKVDGRDIYGNRTVIERDLNWFVKYLEQ